jgi:hypothetical protein
LRRDHRGCGPGVWLLVGMTLLLQGCLDDRETLQITDCLAADGLEPDCRFYEPQDLAALPDGSGMIVSQPAPRGEQSGRLLFYAPERYFDTTGRWQPADSLQVLYPGIDRDAEAGWGDPNCPKLESGLEPRGIDLVARDDGTLALLVVNLGGRKAIEFFEVIPADAASSDAEAALDAAAFPQLVWRGCVPAPARATLGDVAADPDGGFWATQAFPSDRPNWSYIRARLGLSTGYVYRWEPGKGFRQVEGTQSRLPKGIAYCAETGYLYFATYMGDEVRKVQPDRGLVVDRTRVLQPNNLSWALDGSLLVAAHTADFVERGGCDPDLQGACGFAFEIVAIDPETMQGAVLLAHQGAPIGAVDVAVNLGDSLYLASPLGDRVVRFRLDPRQRN